MHFGLNPELPTMGDDGKTVAGIREDILNSNSFGNLSIQDIAGINLASGNRSGLLWKGDPTLTFGPNDDGENGVVGLLKGFHSFGNSGDPERAVDRFLQRKFHSVSCDPGFDIDLDRDMPYHKMYRQRLCEATSGLDEEEQKIFDEAFKNLSKEDQEAVRKQFKDHDQDMVLATIYDRPMGMSAAVRKFRDALTEQFKPIEEERERRESDVYKNLTEKEKEGLRWESTIPV